jgi:dUTP pyrophosphatase
MKVRIKKLHQDAVIPSYAKEGDAGLDLIAISENFTFGQVTFGFGLAFEIPEGYVGLIFPRSSIRRTNLELSNSVGVIDSGYRGEVQATFNLNAGIQEIEYTVGCKIAQMIIVPYPKIEFEEVSELSGSERGTGGFGHTGA